MGEEGFRERISCEGDYRKKLTEGGVIEELQDERECGNVCDDRLSPVENAEWGDVAGDCSNDEAASDEDKFGECNNEARPVSKSAQKRLLKMERYQAHKLQRKAREKERRRKETEQRRKVWGDKLASLSADERQKLLQEKKEGRQIRMEKQLQKKERLVQAMDSGRNLVLDLEFSDHMNPNEQVSLVQQVMYSYAANAKSASPMRLSLTGCKGPIKTKLENIPGFSNWLLLKEERSYLEVFGGRKCDLVYLTADSEHVLDQLEESKIYIIGGLVDRNRWKGLTHEKAKRQGILTAKLPISKHLRMASSQVLTVNQVVEIILAFLECKEWANAFYQTIPQRKRAAEKDTD
eukprot:c642_g1_i1 orf=192-1238(+)